MNWASVAGYALAVGYVLAWLAVASLWGPVWLIAEILIGLD